VSILPGVDPDLVRFVEACLVREPERRLADLSEVASWAGHVDYKNLVS
jgi:hypothetical protein